MLLSMRRPSRKARANLTRLPQDQIMTRLPAPVEPKQSHGGMISPPKPLAIAYQGTHRHLVPRWRNGRRSGLKIHRAQAHGGSSPPLGTNLSCGNETRLPTRTTFAEPETRPLGPILIICAGRSRLFGIRQEN